APATATAPAMTVEKDRFGNLILKDKNINVLQYNTLVARLPGYIDPAFRRNGYVHPAWSPAGNVLTNVNPVDHMHHYGIWNPWTSVEYDGKHYDLWNIGDKTGTVRFDSLYSQTSGDLYADILVRHRHVIFQPMLEQQVKTVRADMTITPKVEKIIMDEMQELRAWNAGEGVFVWDFNFNLHPSAELPVILKEYRYAGFGWRATPDWTKENCEMMTSEGKSRPEIDGTNARWVYVTGISPKGKSGILFMASPQNHNFPEPLRIWDETQNSGRGDAFINFAPTKNEDWILQPGNGYMFRYRLFVFDGDMTPARAEEIWKDYANPVKVSVTK
ncbi:MAG: PmoA family protein, partial [Tannerella sp.]|nr:PmoA family protein [Tannerella sp.]